MKLKNDCLFFRGDKPCLHKMVCAKCIKYRPVKMRILIIKLAAIGDVLRTTPLLRRLKKENPDCFISWVADKSSGSILEGNSFIDRILELNLETLLRIQVQKYDLAICLDKEPRATALMMLTKADKKLGYGLNKDGVIIALNKEAEYSLILGVDDELKFRKNKKSYPELIFEATGKQYKKEEYVLNLNEQELRFGKNFLKRHKIANHDIIVGLNTGCGDIFATKKWTEDGFVELAGMLSKEKGVKVFLLGGPCENRRNRSIKSKVKKVIDTRCDNTLREFIGLMAACDVIVSADTIAMHLAIALKKRVVAVFGPTCAQEIEMFGRGEKITSRIKCAPCYRQECEKHTCMKRISADMVFKAVKRQISYVDTKRKNISFR